MFKPRSTFKSLASAALAVGLLAGCATGSGGVTGSAAGGNTVNATKVEKCSQTLGTMAFYEDQNSDWYAYLTRNYKLTSTIPVLRLLAQQTGCFVIVERGAMMDNMMQERALERSGELRGGSGFGKGKMVAADYTIRPEIFFSNEDTGGAGGLVGAIFGSTAGAIAGGFSTKETQTTLVLIENRSGVQIAAAIGTAQSTDFFGMGGGAGAKLGAGLGAYSRTPEGKTLVNAFLDSMNQLVIALKDYKTQNVKGGLGKGGQLKVGQ